MILSHLKSLSMKTKLPFITLGILFGAASLSSATVLGFGQIGGTNATISSTYGSNATADGNGFVVTNGATPDISLTWDSVWQVHTSVHFANLENLTVGGGAWDNEGNTQRIGQLDSGNQSIVFSSGPGYALVLNSFDFGHTGETTPNTSNWTFTLTNSSLNVVWTATQEFVAGSQVTISPNFTGTDGETYTLSFFRNSESYDSNGRHGIDNLSFNQVAIPEPSAAALMGIAGLALIARRRK